MKLSPQIQELSLVVVGDFNPAILHPSWFAGSNLIRSSEAQEAKLEVVHHELASFELSWMRLDSTTNRLSVSTRQEPYFAPLRDLLEGLMTLLEHTPVHALGINWGFYYSLPDKSAYDKFGHSLAPKQFWSPGLVDPKTLRVVIREEYPRTHKGYIDAAIAAEGKLPHCVYLFVNDHIVLDSSTNERPTNQLKRLLSENWDIARSRVETLGDSLFSFL